MTKAEMDLGFQRIWDLFAATDRKFVETDRKFAETDRELKAMFAETDARFKRTEQQMKATDKKLDALVGKWGRFVEGLVLPAAKRLMAERGIAVEKVSPRVSAQKNGDHLEIDVLAIGEEHVVMTEVKSTLGVQDVKDHLKDLGRFKTFFPEYKERKLLGAVAGIVIDEGVDRYAYQQGLFVIGQRGDTVRLLNDADFQPKEW